ncbi:hypothetical protein GM921_11995 [Pedobacter sp. LMG 31464]|uniref:DUF6265 domain-containing protein n=1 Tax=Pedobacter planticolens TaxID=2679964 RepID=A0A923E2E2_9SPHI|nr:DUF6265 family protein [Pedobacter planticolens]MBB2146212.1 hypothetical protein [Pedobacter planticolens]
MKKYLILLVFGVAFHLSANAQKNSSLQQFSFILGNWEMKTTKGKITESWVQNKVELSGKSYRHTLNGDSVLMETLLIKKINGNFYYCSNVNGQNNGETVNFKLISTENNTFVFENATHDFPQRIVYQNLGKDELLAWIEGERNGKKGKSEFRYQRKK